MAGVTSPLLTGHVLAQRYLSRFTEPSSADLATWLARFPDHPDAPAVHATLLARLAAGIRHPLRRPWPACRLRRRPPPDPEENSPASARLPRNALLDRTVHERARAGNADSALRMLRQTKGLDAAVRQPTPRRDRASPVQPGPRRTGAAPGRGRPAAVGWPHRARRLHRRPGRLAAGAPGRGAGLFEAASRAEFASPSLQAGAAFWAARAHLRNRDFRRLRTLDAAAAEAKHTFYGLLARRSLGLGLTRIAPGTRWAPPTATR